MNLLIISILMVLSSVEPSLMLRTQLPSLSSIPWESRGNPLPQTPADAIQATNAEPLPLRPATGHQPHGTCRRPQGRSWAEGARTMERDLISDGLNTLASAQFNHELQADAARSGANSYALSGVVLGLIRDCPECGIEVKLPQIVDVLCTPINIRKQAHAINIHLIEELKAFRSAVIRYQHLG